MTIGPRPQCLDCILLRWEKGEAPKCRAFPHKIPEKIWEGGYDHRKPYPGDNGVRFTPSST